MRFNPQTAWKPENVGVGYPGADARLSGEKGDEIAADGIFQNGRVLTRSRVDGGRTLAMRPAHRSRRRCDIVRACEGGRTRVVDLRGAP